MQCSRARYDRKDVAARAPATRYGSLPASSSSLRRRHATDLINRLCRKCKSGNEMQLYAQGEVTSQNLWPRYDRHFVGITWHNAWSYGAKIYCVIWITFDPLVYENVCVITSLPAKCISAISQWKTFVSVLPTRWRRKPDGIEITSQSPYVFCCRQELCIDVYFCMNVSDE